MELIRTKEIAKPIKFTTEELTNVANEIIELGKKSRESQNKARDELYKSFKYRWLSGKLIVENYEEIIDECQTQENFAYVIGENPSVISNNKRAYLALFELGANTWDKVLSLLKEKNINPIISNFEKLGNLLNAPEKDTTQIDQVEKDRKRIEQIHEEAFEIMKRVEPTNKPELLEDAFNLIEDIEEIKTYIDSFNPYKSKWRSEKYLNHVRNFGRDLITMEPCEKCDAHHTTLKGGSGSQGEKLSDIFAIPVSRATHIALESGEMKVDPRIILEAQFTVLSSFLTLNLK